MPLANYLIVCTGALFAVLNPLATIPPFLAMTESDSKPERVQIARRACIVACLILLSFVISGLTILDFFGISVPAFKIAGGILLLRASLEMLQGTRSRLSTAEQVEGYQKDDISITPLAIPLLCGPVTIVTSILLSARAASWLHYVLLLSTIVVIYLLTYVLMRVAIFYSHLLGAIARAIVARLMGLLLAALAVQFVVNGVRELDFIQALIT